MTEAIGYSSSHPNHRRPAGGWLRWFAQPSIAKPASRRPTIFAYIFAMLHESRRRQAERVLQRYRHLIEKAEAANPRHEAAE